MHLKVGLLFKKAFQKISLLIISNNFHVLYNFSKSPRIQINPLMQLYHEKFNVAVPGEISLRLFTPFDAFSPIITTIISTFYLLKADRTTNFSENRPFFINWEGALVYIRHTSWWKLIIPTESPSSSSVGVVRPPVFKMKTSSLLLVSIVITCSSVCIHAYSEDLDRIKFSENDPTWEKVQATPVRAFTAGVSKSSKKFDKSSENNNGESLPHSSLQEFLETYAAKLRKNKNGDNKKVPDDDDDTKNKKSWNLVDFQKHRYSTENRKRFPIDDRLEFTTEKKKGYPYAADDRKEYPYSVDDKKTYQHHSDDKKRYQYATDDKKGYPYPADDKKGYPTDDRKGWVTLDPIPWSVSKVSKWKPKPLETPWNSYHSIQDQTNWDNDFLDHTRPLSQYQYNKKPEEDQDGSKVYYFSDKNPVVNKPFSRPFTVYDQQVQTSFHKNPIKVNDLYNRPPQETPFNGHKDGIITDNNAPNFPIENPYNRRSGLEEKPEPHPFMGDGEWVLLSTTRGYKAPRLGQKSLDFRPQSIRTQKSIQLTVLPPLKNSKVNMTTSHGGLLQVESTFETVEQAHKKYQKQQKDKTKKRKRPQGLLKRRKKKIAKAQGSATLASAPRSTEGSAVLSAMGAGIIPATMAMLLPVVKGRKRRRKRQIYTTIDPNANIEITLPRYF